MRFTLEQSILVVIDVQGKLADAMAEKKVLFQNIQTLIEAAKILDIPTIYTEQAPQKIGKTSPQIKQLLLGKPITKTVFSCCLENDFVMQLRSFERKQVIVCGIEAHVCVYQTVYDLREQQYDVQVVADAISSRSLENKDHALRRMKDAGAILTSTEMILCELIKGADHPKFKPIMALIK